MLFYLKYSLVSKLIFIFLVYKITPKSNKIFKAINYSVLLLYFLFLNTFKNIYKLMENFFYLTNGQIDINIKTKTNNRYSKIESSVTKSITHLVTSKSEEEYDKNAFKNFRKIK
ncbi:hypothetical protein BpHYR1_027231 [Brachionus plicatilis]|uniref:Uncharacterized protein n=1 Tax=Brachionus plicatilis TaxID=10195 RepID=A0A3M7Q681_BRAPC|nr:hypothetical protein BpHYR1_027231 [Brachionus plicatilis]